MSFSGRIRFFVLFALTIQSIGYGLVNPVFPRLMQKFAAGGLESVSTIFGWSLAIYSFAVFFFSPLLGKLSDRFGRRPIVLVSLTGAIIDYGVAAISTHLWVFLVARAVAGALAAGGASIQAAVADVTTPEQRVKSFAATGAAFNFGFVVGPLVGGVVGELGPAMPFWTAASLSVLALVLGMVTFKETLPAAERRATAGGSLNPIAALYGIRNLQLGGSLAVFVILTSGLAIADPIGILFMQARFNWSTSQIGLYTFVLGAGGVLSRLALTPLVVGWLGDRFTILFGMVNLLICMILCNIVWQSWQMFVVLSFMLLGSVTFPTLFGLLSKEVDASRQGELQGVLGAIQSMLQGIGPPISTAIFAYFIGPSAPMRLYGAPMLVCAFFLVAACIVLMRARLVEPARVAGSADAA
jgi:DHA1 family tetracycline resistance protein-like MFS transporter